MRQRGGEREREGVLERERESGSKKERERGGRAERARERERGRETERERVKMAANSNVNCLKITENAHKIHIYKFSTFDPTAIIQF